MANFKALAKSTRTKNDGFFEGKNRLKLDQLVQLHPNGVTVTDFRQFNGQKGPFYLFAFQENAVDCFSGSTALNDIADAWAAEYNGDVIAASNDLHASGGVRLKLTKTTTKTGNTFFDVEVLD